MSTGIRQIRTMRYDNNQHHSLKSLIDLGYTAPKFFEHVIRNQFLDQDITELLASAGGRMVEETSDRDSIVWPVLGNPRKAFRISRAVSGTGVNGSEMTVGFEERGFNPNEVMIFGDPSVQGLVVSEPIFDGQHWIYTFQRVTDDRTITFPTALGAVGKMVGVGYNAQSEHSERGYSRSPQPEFFDVQNMIIRTGGTITGSAMSERLTYVYDVNGKEVAFYADKAKLDALRELKRSLAVATWFSRSNQSLDGTVLNRIQGEIVKTAPGFDQMMSGYNQLNYSGTLTEDVFSDWLLHIRTQAYGSDGCHLVLMTGTGGVRMFDRIFKNRIRSEVTQNAPFYLEKLKNNEIAYGAQVTTYRGLLGMKISLVHVPMFDDLSLFPETYEGFTVQGYNFYVLDIGTYENKPNYMRIYKSGGGMNRSLRAWTEHGSTTPNGIGSSGIDGMKFHFLTHVCHVIRNMYATAKATFIPV